MADIIVVPSSGVLGKSMTLEFPGLSSCSSSACVEAWWIIEYDGKTYTGDIIHLREGYKKSSFNWTPPFDLAEYSPKSNILRLRIGVYIWEYYPDVDMSMPINPDSNLFNCNLTIPTSVCPSVSLEVYDPTGHVDSFGSYLQALSRFCVSVDYSGIYGSEVEAYSLSITKMGSYTEKYITTEVIPVFGDVTIKATVTDSRGISNYKSVTINVTAYTPPKLLRVKAERSDFDGVINQEGDYGKITFSAEITSLANQNTANYTFLYRIKGANTWNETEIQSLKNQYSVTDQICIFEASPDYSYEIAVRMSDRFVENISTIIPISSAHVLVQFTNDGSGVSIGGRATKNNTLDVGIAAIFNDDVTGTALGLAGLPLIPAGSDFNYYTSPGAYSGANANFVNCPSSAAGVLIVSYAFGFLSPSALGIRQVYLPADNSAIYIRILTQANGSWTYGEWKQITLTAVAVG